MSDWTHVAAIFRVDGIRAIAPDPDFDEVFGKECLFESPVEVWDDANEHPEAYLPLGSEGTLEKSVWVNPDRSCMAAYTVSVFGDLRDFSSIDEIMEWFERCCGKCWIRQAAITVENEWSGEVRTTAYEGRAEA